MDWSFLMIAVPVGAFILWRSQKQAEAVKVASAKLERDKLLYEHIKTGMREYDWRKREGLCEELFSRTLRKAKDGELLFETAHLSAFHVNHGPEIAWASISKTSTNSGSTGSSWAMATRQLQATTAPTAPSRRMRCWPHGMTDGEFARTYRIADERRAA